VFNQLSDQYKKMLDRQFRVTNFQTSSFQDGSHALKREKSISFYLRNANKISSLETVKQMCGTVPQKV